MRTFIQRTAFLSLLLLLASCGIDYTISTRIYADGSCERIMTAKLDSTEYEGNPFFVHIDSSWTQEVSYSQDTAENKTIATVTARKKYASVAAMNAEYHREQPDERPNLLISIKRKFRWFYTLYRYEETYLQQFPFKHFPLSDYFTPEEVEVYCSEDPEADSVLMAGMDSLEIEAYEQALTKKEAQFIHDNVFEEFYLELMRLDKLSGENVTVSLALKDIRDTLSRTLEGRLNCSIQDHKDSRDTTARLLLSFLDSHFQTRQFTAIMAIDNQAFARFDEKFLLDYMSNALNTYGHNVALPGILLETNSSQLMDGIPVWEFGPSSFVYSDYSMWAESRKPNQWAFVVTGVLVLLMLVFALLRKKLK